MVMVTVFEMEMVVGMDLRMEMVWHSKRRSVFVSAISNLLLKYVCV